MKETISKSTRSLGLIQMGPLGEIAIRIVAANLQAILEIPVDILDPQDVPPHAFQPHRQQYDAGLILKHLSQLPFSSYFRIVALTSVDLCIPIFTYVFGEAEVGGKVAVVSDFRLRHNEDGTTAPPDRYYERLIKVALHEVAHTLSLYHCEEDGCLMHFSAKVHHLDQAKFFFCDRCEFILRENLR